MGMVERSRGSTGARKGMNAQLRMFRGAVAFGAILSTAASYAVATEWLAFGSAEGRWVYRYIHPFDLQAIGVFHDQNGSTCASVAASVAIITKRPSRIIGSSRREESKAIRCCDPVTQMTR